MTSSDPEERASSAIYLVAGKGNVDSANWQKDDLPRIAGVEGTDLIESIAIEISRRRNTLVAQAFSVAYHGNAQRSIVANL